MKLSIKEAARLNGRVVYLELFVLLLSLYSLGALVSDLLFDLEPATRQLLHQVDDAICVVFLADFFIHWWLAPSKKAFWRRGWIDLLSSIPEISWLRWARVFRIFRILRTLRSLSEVYQHFAEERVKGAFAMVALMLLIAVLFATIAVVEFEHGVAGANIRTAGDGLWWAFATVTTIGYGDRFPVTAGGRVVAVVLVVFGISFFGTFTAYVASFFIEKAPANDDSDIQNLVREVRQLRVKIEQLETTHGERAGGTIDATVSRAKPSGIARSTGEKPG